MRYDSYIVTTQKKKEKNDEKPKINHITTYPNSPGFLAKAP
jgi:hypothetical protein